MWWSLCILLSNPFEVNELEAWISSFSGIKLSLHWQVHSSWNHNWVATALTYFQMQTVCSVWKESRNVGNPTCWVSRGLYLPLFEPLIFWISLELRINMPFLKRPTCPEGPEPDPDVDCLFLSLELFFFFFFFRSFRTEEQAERMY